jgi:hypothetical protein
VEGWSRRLTPQSFVRRLHGLLSEPDCSLVWFLGAGCSISSGEWAKYRFETFDPVQPALLYGALIDQLFPLPRERQQEVERLTSGKEPSVGYALLAVLIAHEQYGPRANVILTTNFDDLALSVSLT